MPIARSGVRQLAILVAAAPAAFVSLPAMARADYAHVVSAGETLTSVAAQDGLSISALAAANGISTQAQLVTGTVLEIPPQGGATGAPAATSSAPAGAGQPVHAAPTAVVGGGYVIAPGDTLSAIAARHGTTVAALAALNGLDPLGVLYAGATLRLPAGAASSTTPAAASSVASTGVPANPQGAAAEGTPGAPPYPTNERVSAGQIGGIAQANGVPPAFAQAIGWQESGFNNNEVSPAGAVGVMQILPGTWSWINQYLTGGGTLAPASASSNVTGGVLMLRDLLSATGSQTLAAAGYFQGLQSVQQNGMYPSTSQYVADVLALEQQFGG